MKIRQYDVYSKYSSELIPFGGRTFRIIRTHPKVIWGQWNKCVEIRSISKKLVGDRKYLIVSSQKSFGKRFDHFNHPENILQPYSHHQTFFSQLESRSWKFLFGVYVIFMEFFEVNKSLQCIVQGIRHVILHQINELWLVRTHTWKNSSIFWMLKMPNFT